MIIEHFEMVQVQGVETVEKENNVGTLAELEMALCVCVCVAGES